jgi:hypothetical protein
MFGCAMESRASPNNARNPGSMIPLGMLNAYLYDLRGVADLQGGTGGRVRF